MQDMAYKHTQGDEVEDLASLLAFAKQRFPVEARILHVSQRMTAYFFLISMGTSD